MTNKLPLSIGLVIFTFNSQYDIVECIESARLLTKNIVVIDLESLDKTVELVKGLNTHVFIHPFTNYVETVRNFGIGKANQDWIFVLDADERITPELASEIEEKIATEKFTNYKIPRKEYFARKVWLKHGGWWPNFVSGRLFKRDAFKEWPTTIHSAPVINGNQGTLNNPLLHYSKNDYEQIVKKTINFEDIESELLFKANKPVSTKTFFRKFVAELYRRMVKRSGYKDGTIGVIESVYQAFSKTITYLYLYEKKNSRSL